MSWRPTDEWPDGLIVPNPREVEASLVVAAKETGAIMPGPGRRMRKLGRTAAVVVQIALLSFMVLAPSGTFAGKPTSDPTAAQTDAKGKSADAKAKKGSTEEQTAPTTDAKPKKDAGPTTKGNGGSKDKSNKPDKANKPDKTNKGQEKKAAAAAAETTVVAASGEPTITSDKADYAPGDMVTLTGANWQGDEPSGVQVTVNDDAGKTWSYGNIVDVAHDGSIRDKFKLPDSFAAVYNVTATGLDTARVATTSFTDGFAVSDFKQCANEDPLLGSCHWITSIVQSSNSNYAEGMDVPQRLIFTGIEATGNNVHTLLFDHDATKSGIHAYDWLTSYDQAVADSAAAGITLTLNPCGEEIGPPSNLDDICADLRDGPYSTLVNVPDDPFVSADGSTQTRITAYEGLQGDRTITIWANAPISNGNLTLVHDPLVGDTGDSSIKYTLTWESTATQVLVEMAGHIAMANTAAGWGAGNGASSISGGPYHFSLKSLDGDSSGAQDNQIKGADLIEPASITIIKNTVPDSGQDFAYTTSGTGLAPFTLDDNGDNGDGTSNTQVFSGIISFGGKTVTETLPVAGYDLTNIVCSGDTNLLIGADGDFDAGDATVTIDLDEGEDVVCTFTNTQRGSITIIKDTVPNGGQDFAYTDTIPAPCAIGPLDDDADATITNQTQCLNVLPGSYTVTETLPVTGYDLTNIVCSGDPDIQIGSDADFDAGDTTVTIDLDAAEAVSCTFTNTARGSITIIKDTVPNGGQDFAYTDTIPAPCAIGPLDDDADATITNQTQCLNVLPGSYTVTETLPVTGYDLTNIVCSGDPDIQIGSDADFDAGDTTVTIDLDAAEAVSCTFTNTARGSITIIKDTVPNGGQDFAYTDTIPAPCAIGPLDDDADGTITNQTQCLNVLPGSYTVTETLPVTGYDLTNIVCSGDPDIQIGSDADFDAGDTTVTIDLDAAEAVSCTFTNTARGSITIIKDTVPNGGQDFAYTDTIPAPCAIGPLDDDADATITNQTQCLNVLPGSYTVTETLPVTGYDLTNIVCSGDPDIQIGSDADFDAGDTTVTIDLDAAEAVSCTFTNTARGSITIIKDTVPNGGQDFAYTDTIPAPCAIGPLDDDADATITNQTQCLNVLPGSYTVTETLPVTGYDLTNIVCSGDPDIQIGSDADFDAGDTTVTIDLDAAEAVSCTFTNTQRGSITIIKDTVPNGGQDFAYTDTIPAPCAIGPLDDDADATITNQTQCLNVLPGSYTVTETLPVTGYDLTNIVCSGDPDIQIGSDADFDAGDTTVTIDLDAAEAVSCTFTNTARGSITIIKDTVPNGGQDFAYTDTIPAPCAIGPLDDDADATITNQTQCLNVLPGSYTVTETLPVTGYDLTNIVCSGDPDIQIGSDADFDAGDTTVTIDLDAAEAVSCTFTNTARGSITIIKDTVPNGGQDFAYTDTIPAPCAIGPLDDDADATITNQTQCLNVLPGSYTVTETLPVTGYDLTNIVCSGDPDIQIGSDADFDAGDTTVTIDLDAAEAVSCTFTNTQRGKVKVIKTISGVTPPAGTTDTFVFEIRSGATADTIVNNVVVPGAPGTLVESGTASEGSGWIIEFSTFLVPNTTYQLCELVMPGWSTNLGPNPFNLTIGGDNVRVCTDFTVDPGETKTFTVDNTPPPGGEARTIGFWKNWNECSRSNGKQTGELEAALDAANSLLIGDLTVNDSDPNACEILVDLLDKRDYKAAGIVGDGKKQASDPAFNFAAQYIAYLLNIAAGAGTCSAATTAATSGQTILAAIDFDGSSADGDATHLAISAANKALLNQYAATLDLYNNNALCP